MIILLFKDILALLKIAISRHTNRVAGGRHNPLKFQLIVCNHLCINEIKPYNEMYVRTVGQMLRTREREVSLEPEVRKQLGKCSYIPIITESSFNVTI